MRIVCLVTMCSFLNKFSIVVLKRHWTHETQTICWIGTILRPLSQTFLCIGFIYNVVGFFWFFSKQPLFATKHILNPRMKMVVTRTCGLCILLLVFQSWFSLFSRKNAFVVWFFSFRLQAFHVLFLLFVFIYIWYTDVHVV
jgi:hypothetical protein